MSLTAEDFRIEDTIVAVVNNRKVVTFKAFKRLEDGEGKFAFCGQFSAPARTAKRDLWQIAAGNDFIRPPGAPRKLDDAYAVAVMLDAESRETALLAGKSTSAGVRAALKFWREYHP